MIRSLMLVLFLSANAYTADWFVWDQATGDGSGDSWANAVNSLWALDQDQLVQLGDQIFVASDHQEHLVDCPVDGGYWWLRFNALSSDSLVMSVNRNTMQPEVMEDAGGFLSYDHVLALASDANWGCLHFVVDDRGRQSQTAPANVPKCIRIYRSEFTQCTFDSQGGPFFVGHPYASDSRVKLVDCCLMITGNAVYGFITREPNTHVTSIGCVWQMHSNRATSAYLLGDQCMVAMHNSAIQMTPTTASIQFAGNDSYLGLFNTTATQPFVVKHSGLRNTFVESN